MVFQTISKNNKSGANMRRKMTAILAITILAINGATLLASAFANTNGLSTVAQRSQPSKGINDGSQRDKGTS